MPNVTLFGDKSSAIDLATLWSEGARLLREQRPADALAAFERLAASEPNSATVWMGVAVAKKRLGDAPGELAALQKALGLDPRHPQALVLTGDHYAARGDARAASSYYDAVVKLAEGPGVDPAFQSEVARAREMRARFAEQYDTHLRGAMDAASLDTREGRRVRRALDLLSGKADLYLQQPKGLYIPELPNVGYAERDDFPWLAGLEAAAGDIRDELVAVLGTDGAFAPYVEAEPDRPFFDHHGMLNNPSWSAFYLIKGGETVAENAARCPRAMAAIETAPLCRIPGRTPSVLFSLLGPGAHIAPHHGFTNARFICHLPLIVPDGCAMRVGAETRVWREGEACVFDDSVEHEAWNRHPDRLRVVLIFDIWRPELSPAEQVMICDLLQAVDRYGALPNVGD